MKLEIDWLKNNCQLLHYFGLGFIQLKINKEFRLHFYTPTLPPIVPEEDIHNHRYDFNSKILKGIFSQEIFEAIEGNTHVIENESCNVDIKCSSEKKYCSIKLIDKQVFTEGGNYDIKHNTFHRVKTTNAITLLNRSDYKKEFAQVIRKIDSVSVCPFSQKVEEERLWEIINDTIRSF